jgi:hypothetical protein
MKTYHNFYTLDHVKPYSNYALSHHVKYCHGDKNYSCLVGIGIRTKEILVVEEYETLSKPNLA